MRLLHTSDWHLGRVWSGVDLLDTQRDFGKWLCGTVTELGIDAVLVSGDVYDKATPSVDSVALADALLTELASTGTSIVVISGNHDSADRLGFGSRFMEAGGLHMRSERADLATLGAPIRLTGTDGEVVDVVCLPYLDPIRVDLDSSCHARTHEGALRAALDHQRSLVADPARAVVMAHAWVGDGPRSESERELVSVGGTSQVDASIFHEFGYVALGHLHRPHHVDGHPQVVYSGSPIPYSFSEVHEKSVVIVDTSDMSWRTERITGVGRGVVVLRGTLEQILEDPRYASATDCFVKVTLTDSRIQVAAMHAVQQRFPFALELVQEAIQSDGGTVALAGAPARSPADEVEAYMETYFAGDEHAHKWELATRAVADVAASDTV